MQAGSRQARFWSSGHRFQSSETSFTGTKVWNYWLSTGHPSASFRLLEWYLSLWQLVKVAKSSVHGECAAASPSSKTQPDAEQKTTKNALPIHVLSCKRCVRTCSARSLPVVFLYENVKVSREAYGYRRLHMYCRLVSVVRNTLEMRHSSPSVLVRFSKAKRLPLDNRWFSADWTSLNTTMCLVLLCFCIVRRDDVAKTEQQNEH